jgi:hypothetical protein
MTSTPLFIQHAADPTLIKGIYDTCDQWCMYCPATQRCLAYRCNPEAQSAKRDIYRNLADRLYEGMAFLKRVSDAEGRPTPEIDAILSNDPREQVRLIPIDDPIERMGRRYARQSDTYLLSRSDFPFVMRPRPSGPTPYEVFAWFHGLIPAKLYRALVSAAHSARGDEVRRRDALVSVKVTLIGIDRSMDALAAMMVEDHDPRLGLMHGLLRRLRREVEARFPDARRVVRDGLDRP